MWFNNFSSTKDWKMRISFLFIVLATINGVGCAAFASDFAVGARNRCDSEFRTGAPSSCAKQVATPPRRVQVPVPVPVPVPQPRTVLATAIPSASPTIATVASGPTPNPSRVSEDEIRKFKENYGKPSDASIRATLEQSDEAIKALGRETQKQQAVARYIALRSAQLTAAENSGVTPAEIDPSAAPFLNRMKVTLYTPFSCASCDKQVVAMQTLFQQAPMLEAHLIGTGMTDPRVFVTETARLGITIPGRIESFQETKQFRRQPPFLVVRDDKFGKENVIDPLATSEALLESLIAFRKQNESSAPPATQPNRTR
jgi:hypothetical protein